MYKIVPNYVDRRLTQVNIAEQKLPFEPSFGWVGRTDYPVPYGSKDYDQHRFNIKLVLSTSLILCPHSDYERISYNNRDFQSRSYPSENIDTFGFDNDEGDFQGDLGFGRDDLFRDYRDVSNRDRTSNDYEDGKI